MLFYINHCISCVLDDKIQSTGLLKVLLMLLNSVVNHFEEKKGKYVDHKLGNVEVFNGPLPRKDFIQKFDLGLEQGYRGHSYLLCGEDSHEALRVWGRLHTLTLKKGWCSRMRAGIPGLEFQGWSALKLEWWRWVEAGMAGEAQGGQ